MKISQLIKELNTHLEKHGDLDVTVKEVWCYYDDKEVGRTRDFYLEIVPVPKNGQFTKYPIEPEDYYLELNIEWQ